MAVTIKTTLNLDRNIMQAVKVMEINKGTTQTKVINDLLGKAIKEERLEFKIPDYLIANKKKGIQMERGLKR